MIIIMISFFGGFDIDITFLNFEKHLILDFELLWFVTTDLNSEVAWEYGTYVFNLLFKRIISHTKLRTSGLFYQPIIIWLARK